MDTNKSNDFARYASEVIMYAIEDSDFLDDIVGWVGANLNPEDVFDYQALKHWANENDA